MKTKGIKAFNTIFIIGIFFVVTKLISYLQWTFQLVKKWNLPEDQFFSKVSLINSEVQISITAYLVFAIMYILTFGFIIWGLYQLSKTTKLFEKDTIFHEKISASFKKAGNSFLIFTYGTLLVDIAFLFWAKTSNRIINLLSVELIIFLILGYLMFFLSDVFNKGILIQKENELTI